jgi:hypothetical protein
MRGTFVDQGGLFSCSWGNAAICTITWLCRRKSFAIISKPFFTVRNAHPSVPPKLRALPQAG